MQKSIPFLFMRGGSSRGPFFKRKDLPADQDVLVNLCGRGDKDMVTVAKYMGVQLKM